MKTLASRITVSAYRVGIVVSSELKLCHLDYIEYDEMTNVTDEAMLL